MKIFIHHDTKDSLEPEERQANVAIGKVVRAANGVRMLRDGDSMLNAADQAQSELREVIQLAQQAISALDAVG